MGVPYARNFTAEICNILRSIIFYVNICLLFLLFLFYYRMETIIFSDIVLLLVLEDRGAVQRFTFDTHIKI